MVLTVKFKKVDIKAITPQKAHPDDAGYDLYSTEDVLLNPGDFQAIHTGICIELPPMTEAQVRPRSGLAAKHGITVLNTPGTIDAGYRGEIMVILINHCKNAFAVKAGMRIAQLVVKPIYDVSFCEIEDLNDSERGSNGFGSTGIGE